MREVRQPQHLTFRADRRLIGALHERADLAGVSVSEFIRGTVSDRVFAYERNDRDTPDA